MSSAVVTNTFGSQNGPIPLAQLDTNFIDITGYLNNPYNRNNFALDTGTTNTIAISLNPAPAGYTAGLEIVWRQAATNSGACVVNVNSLGNQSLLNSGGATLASGQLVAGVSYKAIHNGTAFYTVNVADATAATQAQMQTATVSLSFVTPANIRFSPSAAKASGWLDGTATGTITGALGTLLGATANSSGSGTYNIVFAAAMADTRYAVLATPYHTSLVVPVESTRTTSGFTIITQSASTVAIRPTGLSFAVFGTLA